jgi:hypothetical protein
MFSSADYSISIRRVFVISSLRTSTLTRSLHVTCSEFVQSISQNLLALSLFFFFSTHFAHSFLLHHLKMIVFSSFLLSFWEIFTIFSSIVLLFEWSVRNFMNEDISKQIKKVSFQIRDFLRTNHKFDDLVFVDIKSFVSNIIKDKNSSITLKSRKTRFSKSSNNITWSQTWAINRDEFKRATPRNGSGSQPNRSVWFRFLVRNQTESKAQKSNHWYFGLVWFSSVWNQYEPTAKEYIRRRWDA